VPSEVICSSGSLPTFPMSMILFNMDMNLPFYL
jgi:hypothetical protein